MSADRIARCGTVANILICSKPIRRQIEDCGQWIDDGWTPPHIFVWIDEGEEGFGKSWPLPPNWRAHLITDGTGAA